MMPLKGVGRKRTLFIDDLKKRRRYWELKEEAKIEGGENESLSYGHKEGIKVNFQ